MLLRPPPVIINGLILTFCSTITVIQYLNNPMQLQIAGYRSYIIANEVCVALEVIKINSVLSVMNVAPLQGERHRFAIPMVCMS